MRKIAQDRGIRLSNRIVKMHNYLRDEAQEDYLAEQIMKYGSAIGADLIRLQLSDGSMEYIDHLHKAMVNVVKTMRWLNIINDRGYIEYRTYISMRRECSDLIDILMRKTSALVDEIAI